MKTLLITLLAEQPLLLTSLQGDPNSGVSFPYIPGSVLRGALIHRYRERHCAAGDLDLADPQTQRLFFDGTTRYLNAYLLVAPSPARSGKPVATIPQPRGLPLPRAWMRRREDGFHTPDPQGTLSDLERMMAGEQRLKICQGYDLAATALSEQRRALVDEGVVALDEQGNPWIAEIARHINVHNQRDRPRGRGVEGSGAVFRYDALAPGQQFQAAVICADQADATVLADLLAADRLWLGGSRSAGYGRARITATSTVDSWHEVGQAPERRLAGATLQITLLSDLIARDANGLHTTAFPVAALAQILNATLQIQPDHSFTAAVHAGGFNRTWGLPLPQTPALAAGSVLSFTAAAPISAAQIADLELQGLGERRVEGFGRVAVNWHPGAPTFVARRFAPPLVADTAQPARLSMASEQVARQMAQRMLRRRLDEALVERLSGCMVEGDAATNTQFSRLRIVARRALDTADLGRVQTLIAGLPAATREKLRRTRIVERGRSKRLLEWLEEAITDGGHSWATSTITVAGVELSASATLQREYTLRLIMAVARLAVKEERKEEQDA